jgi:hypothetical protein
MGEMLSYRDSRSTAFVWQSSSRIEYADENYAREVMQLFSVGLYMLHNNGTRVLEESGNFVQTYTNDDISEYARLWTGFQRQPSRGNIEDPTPRKFLWARLNVTHFADIAWTCLTVKTPCLLLPEPNRQDPMRVTLRLRDNLPKVSGRLVAFAYKSVCVRNPHPCIFRWVSVIGTLATGFRCARICQTGTSFVLAHRIVFLVPQQ